MNVVFLYLSNNARRVFAVFGFSGISRVYFKKSTLVMFSGYGSKTSTPVTVSEMFVHVSLRMSCSLSLTSDTAAVTSLNYFRGLILMLDECVDSLSADSEG